MRGLLVTLACCACGCARVTSGGPAAPAAAVEVFDLTKVIPTNIMKGGVVESRARVVQLLSVPVRAADGASSCLLLQRVKILCTRPMQSTPSGSGTTWCVACGAHNVPRVGADAVCLSLCLCRCRRRSRC
jgi:hypothetical protein